MGNEIPDIIYLNEGGKGLYNLKEEYNDMKRFNEIDNMPTVIPKDVYNEWVELISKYHIEVSYYLEEEEYNCLEKEHNDMKRLDEIDAMPEYVSEEIYNEWVALVSKYHLEDNYY